MIQSTLYNLDNRFVIEFIFYNLKVEVFQVFCIIQIDLTQMLAFVDCLLYLGYFPVVMVVTFIIATFAVAVAAVAVLAIPAAAAFEVNIVVGDQVAVVVVVVVVVDSQILNQEFGLQDN
jgi:hypothetical protein